MQIKNILAATATLAVASAQNNSLTAVLNATADLSTLKTILYSNETILNTLAGLTNITLFAPSNEALAPLLASPNINATLATPGFLAAFLEYHVVKGAYNSSAFSTTPKFLHTYLNDTQYSRVSGGQVVEGRVVGQNVSITSGLKSVANVTTANVNISNGIVHIIDNYLHIPANASTTALDAGLTSFAGALSATNLTSTIDSAKDITVFAPTNAAFEAISNILGTLNLSQAASILEYHVINGTVAYSSLLANTTVKALTGANLNITVEGGAVFVDSARVIGADILVSGGVIHVIDQVLNPNGTATPVASVTSATAAYSGATSGSVAPFTSLVTATTTVTALTVTNANVASGYSTAPTGALSSAAASAKSTSNGAAAPLATMGAMGAAALFGGAFLINL